MGAVDESIEFCLSITPAYFIQVVITMQGSIVTVLVEITTLEWSIEFERVIGLIENLIH